MTMPVWGVLIASMGLMTAAPGPDGPVPPCGAPPVPAYAAPESEPAVRYWERKDVSRDWKFPSCVPWTGTGFASMVTVSARFRHLGGADALISRVAAISGLKGIRYWSKTHGEWRTFIEDASALSAPDRAARRKDFSPDEIRAGAAVYFLQQDNVAGNVVYRLRVHESSPNRVVVGMENAGSVKKFFKTILHPTDAQMLYFFDRQSNDVWSFYGIMRVSDNASSLATGSPQSAINRAVAYYRHFAGIPTDKDPPAAK